MRRDARPWWAMAGYWVAHARRRRWRSAVALLLLVAATEGLALGALGAAMRTATAWDRFLTETRSMDYGIEAPDERGARTVLQALDAPFVEGAALMQWVPVAPAGLEPGDAGAFTGDGGFGTEVMKPLIVEGRAADPARADEFTANEVMVEQAGLRVGQRTQLLSSGPDDAPGPTIEATLVGIHRTTLDLGINAGWPVALLTPAFRQAHGGDLPPGAPVVVVRLAPGPGSPEAMYAAIDAAFAEGQQPTIMSEAVASAAVEDAIRVQAVALWALGGLAATVGLVVTTQFVGRESRARRGDRTVLTALGLGRRPRRLLTTLPDVVPVALGAACGSALAVTSTQWFPFGLAGDAEPDPGLRFDPLVHVVLALLGAVAVVAWSYAASADPPPRRYRQSTARWRIDGPLSIRTGLRWASPLRSADGAPVGVGYATVGVAVAGILTVGTLVASADELQSNGDLFGWDFDLVVNASDEIDEPRGTLAAVADELGDDSGVAAAAHAQLVRTAIEGRTVEVYAVDQLRGSVTMTITDGRPPVAADEVALGHDLADHLRVGLGDDVTVGHGSRSRAVRVVGFGAYPELGNAGMAQAAGITAELAEDVDTDLVQDVLLVRLADGAAGARLADRLRQHEDLGVDDPIVPPTVSNLDRVSNIPATAVAALTALGLAGFVHAMVVSARRRRSEVAVLRALGMAGRQLRRAVVVQAAAVVLVAALGGAVAGWALGSSIWEALARGLGVGRDVVVPGVVLGGLISGAITVLAVGAGIAIVRIRRWPVSAELRAE